MISSLFKFSSEKWQILLVFCVWLLIKLLCKQNTLLFELLTCGRDIKFLTINGAVWHL